MVLLIAVVLDPSQKLDLIKFYFYTIGENVEVKMRELKQYMRRYYLEYEKIVRCQSLHVFIPPDEQDTSEDTFICSP